MSNELGKACRDFAIDFSTERHHEIGDTVKPLPAPSVEFRLLSVARRQRIDLVILSGESQREPLLALAAELCEPVRRRSGIRREIVSDPVRFTEIIGAGDAGLFP